MLAMRCISDDLGRDKSAELLAGALLAGALLLAFLGALQRWAPWLGHAVGVPQRDDQGQCGSSRDNFADYLWLGIASACWLVATRACMLLSLLLTLPALVGLSLMSGSRSVYQYRRADAVAAALQPGTSWAVTSGAGSGSLPRLPPLLLGLRWMIGVLDSGSVASSTAARRTGPYDPVRATLQRAALDIFSEHPLLGAGFGSSASSSCASKLPDQRRRHSSIRTTC